MSNWKLGNTGDEQRMILDSKGRYVCSIQIHQTPRYMGDYDENRRLSNVPLILVAPELLEALKAAEIALANCIPVVPYKGDGPLVNIRKVIAKAEGKSPS